MRGREGGGKVCAYLNSKNSCKDDISVICDTILWTGVVDEKSAVMTSTLLRDFDIRRNFLRHFFEKPGVVDIVDVVRRHIHL